MKKIRIAEIAGMILVLASIGWEFFGESPMNEIQVRDRQYRIESKLDDIWQLLAHDFTHDPANKSKGIALFNYDAVADHWKHAETEDNGLQEQVDIFAVVRFLLFGIGSLLLVLAKVMEMRLEAKALAEPRGE